MDNNERAIPTVPGPRKAPEAQKCARIFAGDTNKVCGRQPGHLGLHGTLDGTQPWWTDNESLPIVDTTVLDGRTEQMARVMMGQAAVHWVTDGDVEHTFQVTDWAGIRSHEQAQQRLVEVFAEKVQSPATVTATLLREDGTVAGIYTRPDFSA